MQACSLSANTLACRRGDRVLFHGVDLDLKAGGALHITGVNGIGKSSLIRILAGLLRAFAGAVDRSGTIGLMDERPALDPQLPLGQALGFWAGMDTADGLARQALAQRMNIAHLLDVPVRYLSTGQKKRAGLARLQGQQASIWLLDEPLNGLDKEGIALVERLVNKHIADGGIAVIASHQPITIPDTQILALEDFAA